MRIIKILLSLNMALMCLVYVLQNLVNIDAAFAGLSYVMSNADHVVNKESIAPAVTRPGLVWTAMVIVFCFEMLAGLLILNGVWHLWSARKAAPAVFQSAKKMVYVGAGLGMLTWFGLFHVAGGAWFQMWQTAIGGGSLSGAFWIGSILALSALFIAGVPDD